MIIYCRIRRDDDLVVSTLPLPSGGLLLSFLRLANSLFFQHIRWKLIGVPSRIPTAPVYQYDRSGRSRGLAFITYSTLAAAVLAKEKLSGQKANGAYPTASLRFSSLSELNR